MAKKLQVIISNPVGDNKTINFNNPAAELTLADVQSAFEPFFTNQYFKNLSNNQVFTAIKQAKIIETTEENLK